MEPSSWEPIPPERYPGIPRPAPLESVEPGSRSLRRCPRRFDLRRRVEVVRLTQVPRTVADGLRPSAPGELTLEAARRHVENVLLVDDDAILFAQRLILERAKLLVEPSGAAAVAALLEHREELQGQRIVAVLTGGNTTLDL